MAAPVGRLLGVLTGANIAVLVEGLFVPPGGLELEGAAWLFCVMGGVIGLVVGLAAGGGIAACAGFCLVSAASRYAPFAWTGYFQRDERKRSQADDEATAPEQRTEKT